MFKIQVNKSNYNKSTYNSLERFISYFYQVDSIVKCQAQKVLEIGVGNKLSSEYLKSVGIEVVTCDFDPAINPDIVADVRDIPVESKSFDTVVAFQVLEHIPFEDFSSVLGEFARITKKNVIISLPYRSTYVNLAFKFPGIRTLLKRNFVDLSIRIPLRFGGFETSGQHYWEIDNNLYTLKKVKTEIEKYFTIKKDFSPVLNKFHYFFVLEVK